MLEFYVKEEICLKIHDKINRSKKRFLLLKQISQNRSKIAFPSFSVFTFLNMRFLLLYIIFLFHYSLMAESLSPVSGKISQLQKDSSLSFLYITLAVTRMKIFEKEFLQRILLFLFKTFLQKCFHSVLQVILPGFIFL